MDPAALLDCLSTTSCLVTQATSGIVIGMLMFLTAAGLTLVFGVLGINNFAHGAFYLIGAYAAYSVYLASDSLALAIVGAIAVTALIGVAFERWVLRPTKDADVHMQLLACYGVILVIDDLAKVIWGPAAVSMGMPDSLRVPPFIFHGGVVPLYYVVLMAIAVLIGVAIWFLISRTRFGLTVQAVAELPGMVSALGRNTNRYYAGVLALGCGLAGAAGALSAPMRAAAPGSGFSILIDAFVVVIVGGLGSIPGALGAAVLLGLVRSFGSIGFPLFTEGVMFIVMILVMLLKPSGLFARGGLRQV